MSRKGIMDELLRAAAKAANAQPSKQGRRRTERDLRNMLEEHAKETDAGRQGFSQGRFSRGEPDRARQRPRERNFEDNDMRQPPAPRAPRPLTIMESLRQEARDPFRLGTGDRLGIFNAKETAEWPDVQNPGVLQTWRKLRQQELKWFSIQPPRNAFEEMILWTEQGKLWKYPIDNEQGIEEEKNVSFSEHIFLDSWFEGLPEKGPVRQFMDLLALGLSNNPYITVERKRQTFEWFKEYFARNKEILDKAGVL